MILCIQGINVVWEKDLLLDIWDDDWYDIWKYSQSTSVWNRTKAIQFIIFHRTYISHLGADIKNYLNKSPQCLKCKQQITDYFHPQFPVLPSTSNVWVKILHSVKSLLGRVKRILTLYPLTLGFLSRKVISPSRKMLHNIFTFASKKNILLYWLLISHRLLSTGTEL